MPDFLLVLIMLGEFIQDIRRYKKGTGLSDGEEVKGKVVVITGANSGIGKFSALEFAKRGATVIMGCRNLEKSQSALEEIREKSGNQNVELIKLDLEDMESVKEFTTQVKNNYPKINILLNNGGISDFEDKMRTKDGCSKVMMVNYFGHVLLTNLLLDNLKKGSPSRIISVLSSFLMQQKLDLEDIQMKKRMPWYRTTRNLGYVNSKYAMALFTKELGKRLEGTGVTTYSMCPGMVKTDFLEDEPLPLRLIFAIGLRLYGLTPEECAEEYINHLALSASLSKETGLMYRLRKPINRINKLLEDKDKTAKMLWEKTATLLDIEDYTLPSAV